MQVQSCKMLSSPPVPTEVLDNLADNAEITEANIIGLDHQLADRYAQDYIELDSPPAKPTIKAGQGIGRSVYIYIIDLLKWVGDAVNLEVEFYASGYFPQDDLDEINKITITIPRSIALDQAFVNMVNSNWQLVDKVLNACQQGYTDTYGEE